MINWNQDIFNKAKTTDKSIVDAKAKTWVKPLKNDPDYDNYFVIETLKKYTVRPCIVVVWDLPNKVLFKPCGSTTWNECTKDNFTACLTEIGNEILKEFPNTYGCVKFMSYIESQRYWDYNHIIDFEI